MPEKRKSCQLSYNYLTKYKKALQFFSPRCNIWTG